MSRQLSPQPFSVDLSFRDLFELLRRQRWLIFANVVLVVAAAFIYSATAPKVYRAFARVLIEDTPQSGIGDPIGEMSARSMTLDVPTQLEVLQSQEILYKALEDAGIPLPRSRAEVERLPKLKVERVSGTNVIQISVDSTNQEFCRSLADSLPKMFRIYVQGRQRDAVQRALMFLGSRVKEENDQLRMSQGALVAFKKEHHVVDTGSETGIRISKDTAADAEKTSAETAVKAAQAELDELKSARAKLPAEKEVPTTQTNLEQIEKEKETLQRLLSQREQLLMTYKAESNPVRRLDVEISAQRAYLGQLAKKTTKTIRTRNPDLDAYDEKIMVARASLKGAMARAASLSALAGQKDRDLRGLATVSRAQTELENRVMTHQATIAKLSTTIEDLRLRDNSLRAPVSSMAGASFADQIAPRWPFNIVAGLLLGLILGCVVALARDTMQDRANSERDVRVASGLDILARLPLTPRNASPLVWKHGQSLTLDRYRLLRSNLVLASERHQEGLVRHEDEGFRPSLLLPYSSPHLTSLMVTSTFQSEGKSVVAANLASAMALDGRRVILVDANLRMPTAHKAFALNAKPGLTEVLSGKAEAEDALQSTPVEGLSVLVAGELPLNPSGVLASSEMLALHERLKSVADVVIYDSVSSYALADAQALAAIVGSVLFVTQLGAPKKDDLREAVTNLSLTNAHVLGVVLNKDPEARIALS
jgi:polysaccharide biosynthesis transport protein